MRLRLGCVLLLLAVTAAEAARAPRCPGRRYLVSGGGTVIAIDVGGLVTIPGTCDVPRRGRQFRVRRGTKVRVQWRHCASGGPVRLVAVLTKDCTRLAGTLAIRRTRIHIQGELEPPSTTTTTTGTTSTLTTTSTRPVPRIPPDGGQILSPAPPVLPGG